METRRCDQCDAAMINGVFCHEAGCLNARRRWNRETGGWEKFYVCRECGCEVPDGESCTCMMPDDVMSDEVEEDENV